MKGWVGAFAIILFLAALVAAGTWLENQLP